MSFKFNFGGGDLPEDDSKHNEEKSESTEKVKFRECKEHKIDDPKLQTIDLDFLEIGDVTLRYINPEHAASRIEDESITSLITSSDLESGQYEGGLKIWECTYDLLTYMEEKGTSLIDSKNVLDLGCGAGLLGLFTLLKGAKSVCFQDYNSEVVESFTIPSAYCTVEDVKNNSVQKIDFDKLTFLSGDWDKVNHYFKENRRTKFDLILSAETIYNVDYYPKLRDILREHLSPNGVALFAAKTHYFGVGGGTYDFVNFLSKEKSSFDVTTEMKFEHGLCREILKIVKKE